MCVCVYGLSHTTPSSSERHTHTQCALGWGDCDWQFAAATSHVGVSPSLLCIQLLGCEKAKMATSKLPNSRLHNEVMITTPTSYVHGYNWKVGWVSSSFCSPLRRFLVQRGSALLSLAWRCCSPLEQWIFSGLPCFHLFNTNHWPVFFRFSDESFTA